MDTTNPLQKFKELATLKLNNYEFKLPDPIGDLRRDAIARFYLPLNNVDALLKDNDTNPEIKAISATDMVDLYFPVPNYTNTSYPDLSGYFERTQFMGDPNKPGDKDAAEDYWKKVGIALSLYPDFPTDAYIPFYIDTTTYKISCIFNGKDVTLNALDTESKYKFILVHDLPLAAEMQGTSYSVPEKLEKEINADLKTKLTNWYTQIYNDQSAAGVAAANALPPGNPKFWITEKVTSFYDKNNVTGLFFSDLLVTGWTLNEQSYHPDIRLWDVSNVKSMELAFADSNYNKPLSSWERVLPNKSTLANCTNFSKMFINSAFDQYIINWAIKAGSTGKLLNGDEINVGDNPALGPNMNQMVRDSGLYTTDSFKQGFKEVNKEDTKNPGTPPYSLFGQPICFNKGTQILCFKDNKEMYIPVEDLRKGDLVKTLHHGYQPLHKITTGFFTLGRPVDMGMYKMKKQGAMIADLEMSGLHSMLVDEHDPEYADDVKRQYTTQPRRKIYLHEHFRLQANYSSKFEKMPTKGYQIYSFALEGDEIQYPIWANGLLVETTSKQYVASGSMREVINNHDPKCE